MSEEKILKVDKIILKTFLTAFLSALGMFVVMIAVLCLLFPSTMMQISYNMGLDGMSASFAKTAYDRSNDIYYIAYATEVAIGMDDENQIITYGEAFVKDNDFAKYCERKNANLPEMDGHQATGSYEQYIYSQICISMYEKGNTKAVDRAFEFLGVSEGTSKLTAFPRQNVVVALLVNAMVVGDAQTVSQIQEKIEQLPTELSAEDQAYYDEVMNFMQRENG